MRAASLCVAVSLMPACFGAHAQSGVRSDMLTPDGSKTFWNNLREQGAGADRALIDQAVNPISPMPDANNAAQALANGARKILTQKIQEELAYSMSLATKATEPVRPVQNLIDMMQRIDTAMIPDPVQRKKFESEAQRIVDQGAMAEQYSKINTALCKAAIPPIICNTVGKGRIECAGGPQRLDSAGLPPWQYTLVAKCNGAYVCRIRIFYAGRRGQHHYPAVATWRRHAVSRHALFKRVCSLRPGIGKTAQWARCKSAGKCFYLRHESGPAALPPALAISYRLVACFRGDRLPTARFTLRAIPCSEGALPAPNA